MQAVALEAAIEELRGSAGDAAAARQEAGALRIDLEKVRERAEQAAALRGDLESIRDRADAAEAVRNELRAALERIDGLTEETNRLRAHVDAEAGREHGMTADERHRLEVAHREAEEARAGLEAIRAQADELRSQAAELRDEAGQMRAGLSELREGDGHARHDLEALRREQQELRTFIEDTRRERDEAQERLTAALAEVEKARVAAELRAQHTPPPAPSGISDPSIRRRLDRSAQENAALRRDAEAVRAQLVEIAEATQAADRRAQEVRGEIASAREEIGEVREEARDAQKSAREVTERIDLIDRGAANVLAEVRAQKSAIDEAAQLAHSANEAAHEGRATAEEARAAAEEARAAAGEIRSAADEARATAHEGRAAAARAEEGLTATREQVEELRGDVAGAREAAAGAATEAAAAAEQASAAAAEAAAATDQAAHVRDDAITAAREAGSDAVNRVRDELDTMRGELDVARRDLDEVLATDSGADVREAIAALQEDVSRRLREEVDGLGVQIERLRTTQATVAKAVTADAVGALEEGLDELRTALETVRAADPSKEIGGLREELEAVRTDLARLRESDDSDAVVALQQDFKQLRTDIQAIRAKDVTDILGNLDGRLDQLRADVDTIRDSDRGPDQAVTEAVEALRADVEAVQGRLEDLPAPDVVATLRHEVAQLRGADTAGAIERFRAEVQGKLAGLTGGSADQIADLRDSIEELRNRSRVDRGLQAELSSLDLRLAALERQGTQEVNSVIERITEAVTRLDTLGVDVVAVRKDLSTGQKISDERLTSLSAELTAARTDTEQIRRSLDDLKHEMQVVREYAATAKAEGSSALQLATAAQTAGIETDRRVEELRAELADARRMMEEFRQHAQEARRSAKEAKQAAERASTADKATSERFTEVWDELINKSNSGMRSGIHKALKPMPQPEHQVRKPRKGFDDAEQPMAVIGLDGKFKELNPLFAKLIGYDEGEFQKAAWPSVHDRGLYQEQVNAFQEMIAGEREAYDVSSTYMHGQGLMVPVVGRLSVVRNEAGEPASMLLVAEDRQTA
jgi:PAS domain S-box-containing protein